MITITISGTATHDRSIVTTYALVETGANEANGLDLPTSFTLVPGDAFRGRLVLARAETLQDQLDHYREAGWAVTVHRSTWWQEQTIAQLLLHLYRPRRDAY